MIQNDLCTKLNDSVTTRFEILTPEQMFEIKEKTEQAMRDGKIKQRPTQRYWVARYIRDIYNGDWLTNPQLIILTNEGFAIDGMHRLTAGSRAGIPILFNGTDLNTFRVIDNGRVRDNKQILSLAGVENVTVFNAIARSLIQICLREVINSRQKSVHEIERVMHIFEDGYKFVLNAISQNGALSTCRIRSEGLAAMVFTKNVFPVEIGAFCDSLFGMSFAAGSPARAVRLWIDRNEKIKQTKGELGRVVFNGIKATVDGRSVTKLQDNDEGVLWAKKANREKVVAVASIFGVESL